jgi:thymidine phosphorylase
MFSRMDEPLGSAVGNAVEVVESVEVLRGDGPEDVRALVIALAGEMLRLGGRAANASAGEGAAAEALGSGAALERFRRMVEAHGGRLDWDAADCGLEVAPIAAAFTAPERAYLAQVDGAQVGMAVVDLGGGRQRKQDRIDPAVGLCWRARIGDLLDAGAPVAEIRARPGADVESVQRRLAAAVTWSPEPPGRPPLRLGRYPEEP